MMNFDRGVIKNTFMLYMMNIAKMIFPLITLPYLTRVLTVECFGVVAFVKVIMQYMQIIVDFGFNLSGTKDIVLVKNDNEKLGIEVGNILIAKLLLSVVALIVLCILTLAFDILSDYKALTFLSFIVVFLTNFLFDYFFRGIERMEFITMRFVLMRGIAAFATFFVVRDDSDIIWIPILDILGSIVAIFLVLRVMNKLNIKIGFSSICDILCKIKLSAIYFFSLVASISLMGVNTLFVGFYMNTTDIAYWSICLQFITAVQAFYTPLTDAIYPHMVKKKDINILKRFLSLYLPFVILGCVITWLFADYFLLIMGGDQYTSAAEVLKYLTPVMFFSFPAMLFGWPALGAIGKEKSITNSTIVTILIQVIGLLFLVWFNKITLLNLAILRGLVECVLLVLRFRYCFKFRNEFSFI